MGTSWASACDVHKERGRGQGCAVLGEQVDVAVPFPHAAQRQRELPHEVIAGGAVVVLHHKAHQRQLRDLQLEGERLLPARVEAYGIASGWSLPREWGIVGAG